MGRGGRPTGNPGGPGAARHPAGRDAPGNQHPAGGDEHCRPPTGAAGTGAAVRAGSPRVPPAPASQAGHRRTGPRAGGLPHFAAAPVALRQPLHIPHEPLAGHRAHHPVPVGGSQALLLRRRAGRKKPRPQPRCMAARTGGSNRAAHSRRRRPTTAEPTSSSSR